MTLESPATKRQTWAIRCACGLDVRALELSKLAASIALEHLNSGDATKRKECIAGLESRGATGKVRNPKSNGTKTARSEHKALYEKALAAGIAAADAMTPTPMVVSQHASCFDDNSPVVEQWHVASGVCGFAWVKVRPATSSFARWAIKTGHGRKDSYAGGLMLGDLDGGLRYGQSYEKKMACAAAAANVLKAAGLDAYAQGRLD